MRKPKQSKKVKFYTGASDEPLLVSRKYASKLLEISTDERIAHKLLWLTILSDSQKNTTEMEVEDVIWGLDQVGIPTGHKGIFKDNDKDYVVDEYRDDCIKLFKTFK